MFIFFTRFKPGKIIRSNLKIQLLIHWSVRINKNLAKDANDLVETISTPNLGSPCSFDNAHFTACKDFCCYKTATRQINAL